MEGHFGDIGKTVVKSTQGTLLSHAAEKFSQATPEDIQGLMKFGEKLADPLKFLKESMAKAKKDMEAHRAQKQEENESESGWEAPKPGFKKFKQEVMDVKEDL